MNKSNNTHEINAEKYNNKVTDEQFLEALYENNGMYAATAKALEEKYTITLSRQAVRKRAESFPDDMKVIRGDIAMSLEHELIKCALQDKNMAVKIRAITFGLNALGKERGYGTNGIDRIVKPKKENLWDNFK